MALFAGFIYQELAGGLIKFNAVWSFSKDASSNIHD